MGAFGHQHCERAMKPLKSRGATDNMATYNMSRGGMTQQQLPLTMCCLEAPTADLSEEN